MVNASVVSVLCYYLFLSKISRRVVVVVMKLKVKNLIFLIKTF